MKNRNKFKELFLVAKALLHEDDLATWTAQCLALLCLTISTKELQTCRKNLENILMAPVFLKDISL